ncbi:hypothetical protein [Pseudonocardia sp. TRM90224]|uniref:hypothetical protein n=1 Tax=Pseudonocardia sp. TRM90224 TaxID=2812678 RepID=UPI001E641123|nr:hypothetical protein [Pseudonocardia sp. TRM90224]
MWTRSIRRFLVIATTAAAALATVPFGSSGAAAATGWQDFGDWKETEAFKIKCRTYVEAVPDGGQLLITHAVTCDHKVGIALNGAVFGPNSDLRGKVCEVLAAHEPCVLSYRIGNPAGRQEFRVSTTSNLIGDELPAATIRFTT